MTNDYRSLDCPAARSPAPNGYSAFRRLVLWTPSLLPLFFRARPTAAEPVSLRKPSPLSWNEPRAIPTSLRQWDYEAWNAATSFPITREDIAIATVRAIRQLDFSFFRLRFDRLTGREKDFLFPCFAVGGTLQRSGDIAEQMGVKVNAIGPLGSTLIDKGMIHSPSHGETSLPSRFLTAFSSANSRFRES
jgi:hypothetical protein